MTNQTPAISQKEVSDVILSRVTEMTKEGLALPKNYNPSNALQVAFLKLSDMTIQGKNNANYGRKVLDVVTKKSVTETLFNMVLQGLSPAKNQVYFIPYKNELQMQRSYFGTQSSLKRLKGIKDIWANVIYEGDDFQMEINDKGRESLLKHDTHWMNRDNPIQGAYAIIETDTGEQTLTVMTKKEINQSWSQAKSQHVHNKFGQEMAKRTVINRAAKNFLNTSDDSDLLINAINETTENEYEDKPREDVTNTVPATPQEKGLIEQFHEMKHEEPKASSAAVEEATDLEPEEISGEDLNSLAADFKAFKENESNDQPEQEKVKTVDWEGYTVAQIRKSLDKHGISYDKAARKDELVLLAERHLGGGIYDQTKLI